MSITATGVTSIDNLIQQLLNGGFRFSLFGHGTGGSLGVTADVTPTLSGNKASATFTVMAQLPAPFNATVQVTVRVDASGTWLVKLTLPDVAAFVADQVGAANNATLSTAYTDVLQPYLAVMSNATLAVANHDTTDGTSTVYAGLNLFCTARPFAAPPLDLLDRAIPSLGLGSISCALQVAFSWSTFRVLADFPANVRFISGLTLTEVALDFSAEKNIEAGATLTFALTVGSQALTLKGSLSGSSEGEVSFWLALDAPGHGWVNPFGIMPGLTIQSFGVQIGIVDADPPVTVAARGTGLIGGVALGFAMSFNPKDLGQNMIAVSAGEIDLATLTSAALGLPTGLDITLRDFDLQVVPEDTTIADVTYHQGVALAGKVDLWGLDGSFDGSFSQAAGFHLAVALDRIDISSSGHPVLVLGSASGNGGPAAAITVAPGAQSGLIDISVGLFGMPPCSVKETFNSAAALPVPFSTSVTNIFNGSGVIISNGQLLVGARASFDYPFQVPWGTYTVSVNASEAVVIDCGASTVGYQVSFSANVNDQGFSFSAGASAPMLSPASLKDYFTHLYATGASGATTFYNQIVSAIEAKVA